MINDGLSNKVYEAIRKAYGYSDEADELVDYVMDLLDIVERVGGDGE